MNQNLENEWSNCPEYSNTIFWLNNEISQLSWDLVLSKTTETTCYCKRILPSESSNSSSASFSRVSAGNLWMSMDISAIVNQEGGVYCAAMSFKKDQSWYGMNK